MGPVQLSLLDGAFADFIVRVTDEPSEYLWLSAAMVSAVTARGHVCLDLAAAAGWEIKPARPEDFQLRLPSASILQQALTGCNSVGRPGEYTPLVLDGEGRLYLHRSWDAERRAVEGIRRHSILHRCDPSAVSAGLNRFFPDEGGKDLQRTAAEAALCSGFTVVSGGPGTGKTTTVARILALLVEAAGIDPGRISLAAPTGKAALRLKQSLAGVYKQLPLAEAVQAAMPREVTTVHRLLGLGGGGRAGRYNRDNPLPCQVLVVDEASMVDLPLMASILEALSPGARVILLGDRDQLASVEAGAVLADICAGSEEGRAAGERPAIIQLTKSYRFDGNSGIGTLSRLINAGDGDGTVELLLSGCHADVCWRRLPGGGGFPEAVVAAARSGFEAFTRACSPGEALQALDSFRILTPLREGGQGAAGLNRLLESAPRQLGGICLSQLKPVMIRENNYDIGLFNGDTGVVLDEGESNPAAYFQADTGESLRRLSSLRLPPHETAYALTVHKSQGSEYDSVLLVLPDRLSDVMCRELLYTAVTRAKKRVEIWGRWMSSAVWLAAAPPETADCRICYGRGRRHEDLSCGR